jgi:adenylylsulfate kinase-like enzyme
MKIAKVIIWFTGFQGSGKTTLSEKLFLFLKKKNRKIKIIDGDIFRFKIKNFKYDLKSREKVGKMKMEVAKNYYDKGYIVLISGVAHKKVWRKNLRISAQGRNYEEIYLKCPLKVSLKRKFHHLGELSKKLFLYKYQEYDNFDLIINTGSKKNFKKSFIGLKKYIVRKYAI